MTSEQREKRWLWWGQIRDVAAAIAGFGLIATEAWRGTYNWTAMVVALACLGIITSSAISRWLIGRWENGPGK